MEENKGLNEKLLLVQKELKVKKDRKNSFGGYNYRNCEDILDALKPLLLKHGITLSILDEIVNIGDRFYVKANAILVSGDERMVGVAYAREELSKKGMDASQITGSASSYARKYALNGLFLIDDGIDQDLLNKHGSRKSETSAAVESASDENKPKTHQETMNMTELSNLPIGSMAICVETVLVEIKKEKTASGKDITGYLVCDDGGDVEEIISVWGKPSESVVVGHPIRFDEVKVKQHKGKPQYVAKSTEYLIQGVNNV